ncbi:B12-binding domain-containing radical SAM protein [Clostridium transplantifaecale]|uniref:B12-binding domain-containing radical SAM protein n=1 Tax=Clostridium transplantifaecale TaxID=2479838 RepID=UPI000F6382B1|nr:B12-binding domain-containing radical SAM protein [Clostridium transplantifaecale]
MKFLLAAINAKYIHSNLGIYSLIKYAQDMFASRKAQGEELPGIQIEMGEYTINHQMELILQDIYRRSPDVVGFSCYIWNILYVKELVRDLKKVLPQVQIWLGGPEVSYDAEAVLRELPEVKGIMAGEGEETFYHLVEQYMSEEHPTLLSAQPGLIFRDKDGSIHTGTAAPLMDLSRIPFSYGSLEGLEHRIIYYESSRGCPFSCSYCLSSIDKTVRFRDLDLVKKELSFFLDRRVPQVKFVDRTFNCKKSHSMEIWKFILEHDNGVTNFHFEISADLLDEDEMALMQRMRPGLIQLEIGVQTTNPDTIREIRRKMDLVKLENNVHRVNSFRNIHQHLDLIAGLPYEDYESFRKSFNDVYRMEPEQLQLGFLKVLKGSYMEEMAGEYGLLYKSQPPYEVLSTRWLSYGDVIRLKGVEEMVEVHYNSGQFRTVLKELVKEFDEPFDLFQALADYYEENRITGISHSRLARYEILFRFINENVPDIQNGKKAERYRDLLMYDLYLRENVKSRPSFAREQSPFKEAVKQFFIGEAKCPFLLKGYEEYDSRQISKMAHAEGMGDGSVVLFDYKNRDALLGNARSFRLVMKEGALIPAEI